MRETINYGEGKRITGYTEWPLIARHNIGHRLVGPPRAPALNNVYFPPPTTVNRSIAEQRKSNSDIDGGLRERERETKQVTESIITGKGEKKDSNDGAHTSDMPS